MLKLVSIVEVEILCDLSKGRIIINIIVDLTVEKQVYFLGLSPKYRYNQSSYFSNTCERLTILRLC